MPENEQNEPPEAPSSLPERKCPVCGKPVAGSVKTYPFCNTRCKTIDLARWATGNYVISRPIEQSDLEEED